jgi:CheY-like chemotaxis protein
MVRCFLAEVLRDEGYEVVEARDGVEAIDLLDAGAASEGVCLMVLDMNLPQVDGIGVLRHLAERGRAIPVIAMSADIISLGRARRHGAREALAKPFDVDRFLETVHRTCGAAPRDGSMGASTGGSAALDQ